jgi:branched-chain amino acid transport system permease protein
MDVFVQQILVGLSVGSIYALVALGYSLVFSTLRVVNFAQGHLVMLSSLITVTLWVDRGWPILFAMLTSITILGLVGFGLQQSVSLAMGKFASPIVWIITTLGLAIIIEVLAAIWFGKEPRPVPQIISGPPVRIGEAAIARDNFLSIGAALAVMFLIDQFLKRTTWGKAVQATAYSGWVPRLMGIPVPRIVTLAFVLSGVIAGIGGALIGPVYKDASTQIGLPLGLFGFIAIVLGGMGSTAGALVGGMLLGLLQTVLRGQLPPGIGTGAIFFFLILLLVVRPSGLFGRDWGRQIAGGEGLA